MVDEGLLMSNGGKNPVQYNVYYLWPIGRFPYQDCYCDVSS